jgi:hypothetical protein
MKTHLLITLCCACAAAGSAVAETLVVDDQVTLKESSIERPKRGTTMSQVESQFGAPIERHATVGSPPITRWDYSGFAVFFEHDRVIHSVVTSG